MKIKAMPIVDVCPMFDDNGGVVYEELHGLGADPITTVANTLNTALKIHFSKLSVDQFFKQRDKVLDQLRAVNIPQECIDKVLAEDCLNHACLKVNYLKDYVPEFNKFTSVSVQKMITCALIQGAISKEFYDAFIATGSLALANEQAQAVANQQQQQPVASQSGSGLPQQQQPGTVTASASDLFTPNVKTALLIGGGVVALTVLALIINSNE